MSSQENSSLNVGQYICLRRNPVLKPSRAARYTKLPLVLQWISLRGVNQRKNVAVQGHPVRSVVSQHLGLFCATESLKWLDHAGDELLSDAYDLKEAEDGFFLEVEGKVCSLIILDGQLHASILQCIAGFNFYHGSSALMIRSRRQT